MLAKVGWRIFFILFSAGAIAYSVYEYLESLRQTVVVIVAAKDIPAHTEIAEDMVKEVEVSADSAHLLLRKPVTQKKDIVGGITLQKIEAGRPVELDPKWLVFPEQRQLYLRNDGSVDISYFIPKDKRLMTVALTPESAVNNTLKKGDWVDVIFTSGTDAKAVGQSFAHMILQQVEVFDIEQLDLDRDDGKENVIQHVTLLVSPQDAVKLSLAKHKGKIDLVLNPWNGEREKVAPITDSLLIQ